jgi:hypothetical protein
LETAEGRRFDPCNDHFTGIVVAVMGMIIAFLAFLVVEVSFEGV